MEGRQETHLPIIPSFRGVVEEEKARIPLPFAGSLQFKEGRVRKGVCGVSNTSYVCAVVKGLKPQNNPPVTIVHVTTTPSHSTPPKKDIFINIVLEKRSREGARGSCIPGAPSQSGAKGRGTAEAADSRSAEAGACI